MTESRRRGVRNAAFPLTITATHSQLGSVSFRLESAARLEPLIEPPAVGWEHALKAVPSSSIAAILNGWAPLAGHPTLPQELTLLSYAVALDDRELVRLLLECGADPNIGLAGYRASTVVFSAVRSEDVARMLIEAGADLGPGIPNGSTPLHFVRVPGVARLLLEAGCDPEAPNLDGVTPIMLATQAGGSREVHRVLREAAMRREPAKRTPSVQFRRAARSAGDHGGSFLRARLRAGADWHWAILAVRGSLAEVTSALASALRAKRTELDVASRRLAVRDGVFVFLPANSSYAIAFLDADDSRTGTRRRALQDDQARSVCRTLRASTVLLRDGGIYDVSSERVQMTASTSRRVSAEAASQFDTRVSKMELENRVAEFEEECSDRGVRFPNMEVESNGVTQTLRIFGWRPAEVGQVNFVVVDE